MNQRDVTALLRGKTIARVRLNTDGKANGGGPLQHVVLELADGTRLSFLVLETEADYGTAMMIRLPDGRCVFTDRPGTGELDP